ncbi:type VII secretion protein EssB/YukC, partial [Mediterraneibacter gnavus]|uniref:type VII secretion protein EssB/YukC n=1 Tax=Mediterraneibacter gnavus TaxID=33038 RepID=UPI0021F759C9
SDYVTCIDCMRNVKVQNMTAPQKFMLANAYVRSENLTQEQKDNILAKMTLNDTESKLAYRIFLHPVIL